MTGFTKIRMEGTGNKTEQCISLAGHLHILQRFPSTIICEVKVPSCISIMERDGGKSELLSYESHRRRPPKVATRATCSSRAYSVVRSRGAWGKPRHDAIIFGACGSMGLIMFVTILHVRGTIPASDPRVYLPASECQP